MSPVGKESFTLVRAEEILSEILSVGFSLQLLPSDLLCELNRGKEHTEIRRKLVVLMNNEKNTRCDLRSAIDPLYLCIEHRIKNTRFQKHIILIKVSLKNANIICN